MFFKSKIRKIDLNLKFLVSACLNELHLNTCDWVDACAGQPHEMGWGLHIYRNIAFVNSERAFDINSMPAKKFLAAFTAKVFLMNVLC